MPILKEAIAVYKSEVTPDGIVFSSGYGNILGL